MTDNNGNDNESSDEEDDADVPSLPFYVFMSPRETEAQKKVKVVKRSGKITTTAAKKINSNSNNRNTSSSSSRLSNRRKRKRKTRKVPPDADGAEEEEEEEESFVDCYTDHSLSGLISLLSSPEHCPLLSQLNISPPICRLIAEMSIIATEIAIDHHTMKRNITKKGWSAEDGYYGLSRLFERNDRCYCSAGDSGNCVDLLLDLGCEYTITGITQIHYDLYTSFAMHVIVVILKYHTLLFFARCLTSISQSQQRTADTGHDTPTANQK